MLVGVRGSEISKSFHHKAEKEDRHPDFNPISSFQLAGANLTAHIHINASSPYPYTGKNYPEA